VNFFFGLVEFVKKLGEVSLLLLALMEDLDLERFFAWGEVLPEFGMGRRKGITA
jgi:hypothetical protein